MNPIKAVHELLEQHFLVEDYQRGYKWTEIEVNQLLEDIHTFNGDGFYCLQPVVVKRTIDGKIELIDGQQRITTIFLILNYLKEINTFCGNSIFKIDYDTRKSSTAFLKNIKSIYDTSEDWKDYLEKNKEKDNIDNYHFFHACIAIKTWFENKENNFKKAFLDKLLTKVKVIWYEVPNTKSTEEKKESIDIFTRINSGKIPLTNAELIKALFLINIEEGKNAALLQLKQNEIAQQWDQIEYALQDDAFWYLLTNENPTATRIDFIFNLIHPVPADKKEEKLHAFLAYNESFQKNTNSKKEWVEEKWEEVKETFMTLQEWFEDREFYHFIGFLVWNRAKINDILSWKKDSKSKLAFKAKVKEESRIKLKKDESLDTIEYGDYRVKGILLLFNILTILNNKNSDKFSFSAFKNDNWDIEHIHAQHSEDITQAKHQLEWVSKTKAALVKIILGKNNALFLKQQKLLDELGKFNQNDRSVFNTLFQEVINFYALLDENYEDLNALSNLALLDAGTNRAIKNAIFSTKRDAIIQKDEGGKFIPICTKHVFLKYYSKGDLSQMFLWKSSDRKSYFEKIEKILSDYLTIN